MNPIIDPQGYGDQSDHTKNRRTFFRASGAGATSLVLAAALPAQASAGRHAKKVVAYHGMPWEEPYGYAQAVKMGDTIYISGQLSHDDKGNIIGPAPLDAHGRVTDFSNTEIQMQQTYKNARMLLAKFGATLDNVVEEVIYVLDMDTAFAVAGPVRKKAYNTAHPLVASTILVTPRLALPTQLLEIRFVARV